MKKVLLVTLFILFCSQVYAENIGGKFMYIKINNNSLKVQLENNSAAQALTEMLKKGNINVNVENYGGFEIVGELPTSLPKNDKYINTNTGDVMLYLGKYIVVFYGTNSYSYTPLGKIVDTNSSDIAKILKNNNGSITLSLD